MKKTTLTILVIVTSAIIFSFTTKNENKGEIKITVTADNQTTFDMFQDSKTTKGLTTPYEIKVKTVDGKFIFKSTELKSSLKIKVEKNSKTRLTAEWPITVILIENDKLTTFGID